MHASLRLGRTDWYAVMRAAEKAKTAMRGGCARGEKLFERPGPWWFDGAIRAAAHPQYNGQARTTAEDLSPAGTRFVRTIVTS